MQTEQTNCVHKLEAGQLWKLEHGFVQILELGKRHVYYKMLRQPEQKAALTRMISLEAMLRFLQSEAVLVAKPQEANLSISPQAEQATVVGSAPGNGLMLGLLGKGLEMRNFRTGDRAGVASSLSCLCSRGVNQLQNLLGQAQHPA